MKKTYERMLKIQRILRKKHIHFVVLRHDGDSSGSFGCDKETTIAYTLPGGVRRIVLCPAFFARDPDCRAETILHELVHEIGFFSHHCLELPRFFGQVGYAARDPRAAMSSSC